MIINWPSKSGKESYRASEVHDSITIAMKVHVDNVYLSIYQTVITLKEGSQDKEFRVHGEITLLSPSAPCIFVEV